jgi:four helix bundle protein
MALAGFRDLKVWQASVALVEAVYRLTREFPADERFGLTQQVRRAAISVPSNIAEGHARRSTGDYLRFLSFAAGSLAEVHTQVLIASRLQYVGISETDRLLREIEDLGKMLTRLKQSLQRQPG